MRKYRPLKREAPTSDYNATFYANGHEFSHTMEHAPGVYQCTSNFFGGEDKRNFDKLLREEHGVNIIWAGLPKGWPAEYAPVGIFGFRNPDDEHIILMHYGDL